MIDDGDDGEAAGEALHRFDQIAVVEDAEELGQDCLIDAGALHLVKQDFHRLEPIRRGVAMGVDYGSHAKISS